jgi:hypothetical protein
MKSAYRHAIPVLLIAALAACDRDNASETAQAPGAPLPASEPLTTETTLAPAPPAGNVDVATAPQLPAESAGAATAAQPQAEMSTTSNNAPQASTGTVASASPEHTKAMEQLHAAAQRLREATQEMAKQPAGERRNLAIRQANEALVETQQAMMRLPPELRTEGGALTAGSSASTGTTASATSADTKASAGASGTSASAGGGTTASAGAPSGGSSAATQGVAGSPGYVGTTTSTPASGLSGGTSAAQYDAANARVMDKLLGASQQLREALQELAQQPSGTQRDQAMKEARQALYDTQQAMIRLPTAARTQKQ